MRRDKDLGEIISVGSVNVDFQVRTERWPEPGETLPAHDFLMTGGGKAANVAFLARRLGVGARLIAHVGDDSLADHALRRMQDAGVDLRWTKRIAGQATGVSQIVVRPDGEKTIILSGNANDAWEPADADAVAEATGSAPTGSVLVVDFEVPAQIVRRAAETAKERRLPVVLDPSPAERVTADIYGLVDVLTPNPAEAEQLTGVAVDSVEDAIRAGEMLLERGAGAAVMKLGGGGCVVVTGDGSTHIGSIPVEVVDATGAGDAFAGALGVALLEGRPMVEAARVAVAASHCAVTRYGSQEAYPVRDEIERMLARMPEP